MSKTIHGTMEIKGESFAIVVSQFNEFITSKLLQGATDCLTKHGCNKNNITTVWVPGAFEVPMIAKKLAKTKNFDAIICLSAIIRGQTSHYDYVCQQITKGVGEIGLETQVPTLFGVITCDTLEQAIDRAGAKCGNIGYNAACSAIEMINVIKEIDKL